MLPLQGKRIFILEDNPMNRVVFQIALVTSGAQVEFERGGKEAVFRLKRLGQIDLIVLDLLLGNNISGFDVFTEIRQHAEFDHLPIVAVSGVDAQVVMPRTRQMGFAGFIGKPISEDLFAEQLAQILAGEAIWYDGTLSQG